MQKLSGKWLVACSGGADSMALLVMCMEEKIDVAVAHVNYHHRKEADEEERYVRAFCEEHGIECHVKNDPFVYEGNFEAAARVRRYEFFRELMGEYGYRGILVAHHEDDHIETYLMQKERNIVPAYYGLKEDNMYHGMLVKRPLLHETKRSLEAYCRKRGVRYCIDQSNFDLSYTRNRIRHEVVEHLTNMEREMILKEIAMENATAQERRCRVRTLVRDDCIDLEAYRVMKKEDRLTLLRLFADERNIFGMREAFLEEVDHIIMHENDFEIPMCGKRLVQNNGKFFLERFFEPYVFTVRSEEELLSLKGNACFAIREAEQGVYAVRVYDSDYPLTIRCFKAGDTIRMRFGTKKVSRFFIDRKIPKYLRNTWPVVVNKDGDVILVPGLGCDICHFSSTLTCNVLKYPVYEGESLDVG